MNIPVDCIVVGGAILVFSRLGQMETSFVNIGQSINASLHAIERFLDRHAE
jgi:hypothetical protein